LQRQLNHHASRDQLIEIILDLGRRPEARFIKGPEYLSQKSFRGKILITRQNELVNLVTKIEQALKKNTS
jgi:stage III sporulation protein SpoIIIAA